LNYTIFFTLLKKRFFLVLVTVVLAATAGGAVCMVLPVKYQARAVLRLGQPESGSVNGAASRMDYNSLMMYRQLARTYSELATSRPVLQKLSAQVDQGLKPDDLRQMVTVRKVKDLELLEILVLDTSPYRAAYIANSLAVILQQEERDVWKMNNLQLIASASAEQHSVGPGIFLGMLTAGLAGLFISVLLVAAVEYQAS